MKQRDVNWIKKKLVQGISRERIEHYLSANYSQDEIDRFLPKVKKAKKKKEEAED